MFTRTLITAAAIAWAATAAAAGEATPDYPMAFTSKLSRDEVRTGVVQAHAAGLVAQGELLPVAPAEGGGLTRAQVKAETLEAIRVGAISKKEHNSFPSARQLELIRSAGERALSMSMSMSMAGR